MPSAYAHDAFEVDEGIKNLNLRAPFRPRRSQPIYAGEFLVGVILIRFPDTRDLSLKEARSNFHFRNMSVEEYFQEYSQGKSWPKSYIIGEEAFPANVYMAPEASGYYCPYDFWENPLGYKQEAEGRERVAALKKAARDHVKRYRVPASVSTKKAAPDITMFMYETRRKKTSQLEKVVSQHYGKRKHPHNPEKMAWELYKPKVVWRDPLWPSSYPQVLASSGAATYAHELGHRLGAPDFYHAPEKNDGTGGDPTLAVSFGPTGPAYCRYIYNGFLSEKNYPTFTQSGTYTLHKRSTNPAGELALGCFVPSRHPHYIFCLEYVSGEQSPLGNPGKQGMLVHVINRTMGSSFLGGPDLCYTYRPNDPWFRSKGSPAHFLKKSNGSGIFNQDSNPASTLPNLLDSGVAFEILEEDKDTVTFKLSLQKELLSPAAYQDSLLPKVHLLELDQVMATSIRAKLDVRFRGEPLIEEYGFCWSERGSPKRVDGFYTPLYHRDTYQVRILGLKPQTTYTLKAYAKSEKGIRYSDNELRFTTLHINSELNSVPPLLADKFSENFYITKWTSQRTSSDREGSSVGGTASTSLLKLATYYHAGPLQLTERYRKKSPANRDAPDASQVHRSPSDNRPDFRLAVFNSVNNLCKRAARAGKMMYTTFPEGFDEHFRNTFQLKDSPYPQRPAIETLKKSNLAEVEEALRSSIRLAKPVLIAQQPFASESYPYGLHWVIIDGYKENGSFHMDQTDGRNRERPELKRKRGWYSLESLLEGADEVKVFWGLKPDFGIQYAVHARMPVQRRPVDVTRLHPELQKSLLASQKKGALEGVEFTLSFSQHQVKLVKVHADGSIELAANGVNKRFALSDFSTVDAARIAFMNAKESGDKRAQALAVVYAEAAGFNDLAKRLSSKARANDLKSLREIIKK